MNGHCFERNYNGRTDKQRTNSLFFFCSRAAAPKLVRVFVCIFVNVRETHTHTHEKKKEEQNTHTHKSKKKKRKKKRTQILVCRPTS